MRDRRRAADGRHTIIAVESVPARLATARGLGADHVIDFRSCDPVEAIMRLTDGRGVDVAIEALGTQATFEAACACCGRAAALEPRRLFRRPDVPLDAFAAGLGDHTIITTLCPGGKERMRRLMNVLRPSAPT